MEEAVDEGEDLDGEGRADQVEGDGRQTVLLQEGHQETKTDEDHHMDVLEHWEGVLLITNTKIFLI